MPMFQYKAMDANGNPKEGKIEATSEKDAGAKLKAQNMFPTSVKPVGGGKKKKDSKAAGGKKKSAFDIQLGPPPNIKGKELVIVTRQIAILLDAGLPLIKTLRTLQKQSKSPGVQRVLDETANAVEGGSTFSEALTLNPKSFDKLFLNMVRAGEAAGAMETVLDKLSEFMEKAAKIVSKVKSAMVYPVVVLTIALAITAGLMVFIVPKFKQIFTDLLGDEPLPALTNAVMMVSDAMMSQLHYIVGGIILIIVMFAMLLKFPKGRYALDWVKFYAPLIGSIISKSSISRFSRTLGTLMGSGVSVLGALEIVRDTAGNEIVSDAIQKVHDAVKEGEGMSGPLAATKIFPQMVISMIEVGEETGKLPEMLTKVANTYDEEVDNAVEGLTSMIEPIMIVGLALVVGTIVIALFMPLISIVEKMGSGGV